MPAENPSQAHRTTPPAAPARSGYLARGVVQGVGFRPFVARLARSLGLVGFVENTSRGVTIEVQGPEDSLARFRAQLPAELPAMARLLSLEERSLPVQDAESGFSIRASRVEPVSAVVIPPDIATCPDCLAEILDPADRRYGYPFTNCTQCGPRYSVIRSVPYDRPSTSMAPFPQCPLCTTEYEDLDNRRFHAQPNACPVCGPALTLLDDRCAPLEEAPLPAAAATLHRGGIVALLGLGGFHLACDALEESAVRALRQRKQRPAKPLAVMVPDLATAREFALTDPEAEELLASVAAPIVLVPMRAKQGTAGTIAPSVAPGQDRLGLFLPYTPLHHLLFREGGFRALVMTSGNRSDEPMLATREEAQARLVGVADRFLVHDRAVVHRVDDSVVKPAAGGALMLRRARGYAPLPLPLPNPRGRAVLAVGAELANTVCVVREDLAYLGPHVGDLKNLDVEESHRAGAQHLLDLLGVTPDLVACDLHPGYGSTRHAEEWAARGIRLVRVQHHEAHAAACMAEHGHQEDAVVLALDGLGYGHDGTLWGGEILVGRPGRFERAGHLVPVRQPGGDRAAREPWRMAASHLRRLLGDNWIELQLPCFAAIPEADRSVVNSALQRGLNAPWSSSCGRLFDAAAALLGFVGAHSYSAQAPMELEALAARCATPADAYRWDTPTASGEQRLLDPGLLLRQLLEDVRRGRARDECSLAFHRGLAGLFAAGAAAVAGERGICDVFLTGGCLQNAVFLGALSQELERRNLRPHVQHLTPPNDGCIAFGQAAWALAAEG